MLYQTSGFGDKGGESIKLHVEKNRAITHNNNEDMKCRSHNKSENRHSQKALHLLKYINSQLIE